MSDDTTQMVCPNCGSQSPITNSMMASRGIESVAILLKSNEAPTDVEEGHIGKALMDAQGTLISVETRIDGLEKLLDELRLERTTLKQVIDEHKVVLSPLRRLSTEILSEILFLSADKRVSLDTTSGSWKLSKVSHRWRQIVVSSSRFWSSIGMRRLSKVPDHGYR